jgi:hypothetical protein
VFWFVVVMVVVDTDLVSALMGGSILPLQLYIYASTMVGVCAYGP